MLPSVAWWTKAKWATSRKFSIIIPSPTGSSNGAPCPHVHSSASNQGRVGQLAERLLQHGPDQAPLLAHRKGGNAGAGGIWLLIGKRGNAGAGAIVSGPLPTVVRALDRIAPDLAHRERGAAVGAAVGDDGRLAALGEEDGERLAEQHGPLRTALQVLDPGYGLPAAAQRERDLLAARRRVALVVNITLLEIIQILVCHSCLPR